MASNNLVNQIKDHMACFFPGQEITLGIYQMGRLVVQELVPEYLAKFPEFNFTEKQELDLLLLLAQLQNNELVTADGKSYQEI